MPFSIDIYYLVLVLPAMLFALYAQFKVKSTFKKYSETDASGGWNGAKVAREILDRSGLHNVALEHIPGELNDHYDPRTKTIRLSDSVYSCRSLAAIGVAAHEAGHAIQHGTGYVQLVWRNSFAPIAGFGSGFGPILAMIGLIFNSSFLLEIGIILFSAAVLFALITLPVEFNASNRAVALLTSSGMVSREDIIPVKKVLAAAAMTYVAAAAVAVANLLRLLLLSNRREE